VAAVKTIPGIIGGTLAVLSPAGILGPSFLDERIRDEQRISLAVSQNSTALRYDIAVQPFSQVLPECQSLVVRRF
jgi:hypothetical protein